MDTRYTIVLMEIKERDIVNIKKKRRIILIVAEFYMKLSVYNHVRNFLLIKFSFNFEIVFFLNIIFKFVEYFDYDRAIIIIFINCIFENILIFK
jgi:hypothetical protein